MKLRALVIDDSRVIRRSLMQLLPQTGLAEFEFAEAEDGAQALALFRSDSADIVFVDWQMPHVDGVEFIRQVRASEKKHRVPIVMVSSNIVIGDDEDLLVTAGADEYILKPFDLASLRQRLTPLIRGIAVRRLEPVEVKPLGFFHRHFGQSR